MGKDYNQVFWELVWLERSNFATLYLPCYFTKERAGIGFMAKDATKPNSGRTIWIEVGYLIHRCSLKGDIQLFIGSPSNVRDTYSTLAYKNFFKIPGKWYGLFQKMTKETPNVRRVPLNMLEDMTCAVNSSVKFV
jgi:hypothetical protein